jgi:hypothetical protein
MGTVEPIPNNIVPDWHISIVSERMVEYNKNQNIATDFDTAIDDIEREL